MTLHMMAIYAGPDQVMGVTSGIAGAVGVLLLFWNKVAGTWFRLMRKLRPERPQGSPEPGRNVPPQNS